MVRRQTNCGGRQALAAASPSLSPQEPCAISPHPIFLATPPSMKDGSWAEVRGGPHLHTVTRSEGHESGGGIGVASISLAHPCMAPGLLSAWGGGATWGQMGRGGGEKGKIRQGHQTLREEGGGSNRAFPKRAGPRQSNEDGQRQGKVYLGDK